MLSPGHRRLLPTLLAVPSHTSIGVLLRALEPREIVAAYEALQAEADPARVAALVREHRLPWECVRPAFARDLDVQAALFERMPLTATIRQLARLTGIGLLAPGSEAAAAACARITDPGALVRSRIHPMSVYLALRTYRDWAAGPTAPCRCSGPTSTGVTPRVSPSTPTTRPGRAASIRSKR